jgi:L,D-peptidoglycan transpeptidase YkuD (ErfK/YbiS/YcfS/YnhG family)
MVLTSRGLRFMGRYIPCAIGRGGLTGTKREGDGATPRGMHRIVGCLYRPDRLSAPNAWARPVRPGDLWSDDPTQADYNQMVRAPNRHSFESLRRPDSLYDIILLTDWNWPLAIPGKGSAIFLHQWRKPRHPTEGCLAFRRDHLIWIAANLSPGTSLLIP